MKIVTMDKVHPNYSPRVPPVERVRPGEIFKMETPERFDDVFPSPKAHDQAVTGPVYVEGARPGQVLKVDIIDVEITSNVGHVLVIAGRGPMGDRIAKTELRHVPVVDGKTALFREDLRLPIVAPMIGRIGVAPAEGEIKSNTVGAHGGNIDNNHIVAGSTVYFPIFVEGALLSLGDIHAMQGDGESGLSALEITADVTLCCSLEEDLPIKRPLAVSGGYVMTMADGATLDEAIKLALADMADLLAHRLDLSFSDAAMLISLVGDARICELVNPRMAAKVLVPTSVLPI